VQCQVRPHQIQASVGKWQRLEIRTDEATGMFAAGPTNHRGGQIGTHHHGLWIALAQDRKTGAGATARIKNPQRADSNWIKAVQHPRFDFSVKKVGIGRPRRAPVELTSNGNKVQAGHGIHRIRLSTQCRHASTN
jgi:hypothetical protein